MEERVKIVSVYKGILDKLTEQNKCADLIALYMFYAYTAYWQGTKQTWCNAYYVCKKLGWGKARFKKTRKKLVEMGYIEIIRRKQKGNNLLGKTYIRIVYPVWKRTAPTGSVSDTSDGRHVGNRPPICL